MSHIFQNLKPLKFYFNKTDMASVEKIQETGMLRILTDKTGFAKCSQKSAYQHVYR